MSKRRKKQNVKKNLLERDNYRCGIHLGGCGKQLTLEETTEDHIIPQNIIKNSQECEKLKKIKKMYTDHTRERLGGGILNLQPMCAKCNNERKKSIFPSNEIIKRCSNMCCKFIYIKKEGKWYILFAHSLLKNEIWDKNKPPKAKTMFWTFLLQDISFEFEDETTTTKSYILFGTSKHKKILYKKNEIGGVVSKSDMIKNNLKYTRDDIYKAISGFLGISNINDSSIKHTYNETTQVDFKQCCLEDIEHYNKNININPNDWESFFCRGGCYSRIGNYTKAIEDYNKVIELNKNYAPAYCDRGFCKLNLGQYGKTIEDCNKAIELNPKDSYSYNNRGLAMLNLSRFKEAILDFKKSVKLNPNDVNIYSYLGIAQFKVGKPREAIESFDKTLTLDPNNKTAQYNKELVQIHLGLNRNCLTESLR